MDIDNTVNDASWPHLTLLLGGNTLRFAKADNDYNLPTGRDLILLIFALTMLSP